MPDEVVEQVKIEKAKAEQKQGGEKHAEKQSEKKSEKQSEKKSEKQSEKQSEKKPETQVKAGEKGAEHKDKVPKKKKERKSVPTGIVHIQATFNNTVITITDSSGNVVCWSSAGSLGFKGSKKSTPFAAQIASEAVSKKAVENGMRSVEVLIKGPGAGREAALRAVQAAGLKVTLIKDVTPIPHNGCRPPKKRRV